LTAPAKTEIFNELWIKISFFSVPSPSTSTCAVIIRQSTPRWNCNSFRSKSGLKYLVYERFSSWWKCRQIGTLDS
jgi:hypothetical protein